jgi:hypothetical protein
VAFAELGLDEPKQYAFDLFSDLAEVDVAKQLDFRALAAFSKRIVSATPLQRELVVLSHGAFPLSSAAQFGTKGAMSYAVWGDMLLRWSKDFLQKIDAMASPKTKRAIMA